MFCVQCGNRLLEESKFCSKCGTPVPASEPIPPEVLEELSSGESETAASLAIASPAYEEHLNREEAEAPVDRKHSAVAKSRTVLWVLLPIMSFLLVSIGIAGDYLYQQHITKQVEAMIRTAEQLSLDGKYAEGQQQIELALKKRPSHPVLLNDQAVLADVLKLVGTIQSMDHQVEAKQYEQALKAVSELKKSIASRNGAVFTRLASQASLKEETFTVLQVTDRLAKRKTVTELVPLLADLKPYSGEAAKKAIQQVKQKIVDLSYEKASKELQAKNFEQALQTVDGALKQDVQNAKLLSLQKMITTKQKAFEEAEQQRIQKAIEASTKEDVRNRTEGVQLVDIHTGVDDYGNFVVSGTVKNVATRSVNYVTVYYDILDSWGNVLYSDTLYVTPYDLPIGEQGSFTNSYYNDGSLSSVNVTRIEWQLE
ncbi:zinc-ribbon domain-containing protein [Paenibacillus sp. OV219]|uniref:zinc-ribbon domain-containing protein n=1 Tax=Paenibacillus sp. OV219 TaxID=1884377 RepID=UPI0015A5C170|nr:zinc-ribbon domain-containing protein [Paenibacillus sp. OV219]